MPDEVTTILAGHPAPEVLASFARGGLPPAELAAVAGHIETCDACCTALRDAGTDPLANLARSAARPADPSPGPLAVAPGAAPDSAGDIAALLRKRLWFISLVVLAVYTYALGLFAVNFAHNPDYLTPYLIDLTPGLLLLATAPVFVVVLWTRRPLSLRRLRGMELTLFGLLLLNQSWEFASALFRTPQFGGVVEGAGTSDRDAGLMWIYGGYATLPYFVLIVAYATLVPSGWRRCTLVVGVMAATPLAISAAACLTTAVVDPFVFSTHHILPMGIYLGVAVGIAAYGTRRVELLRREVAAARELGQYRLKERLGAGGMGEVYLAEHVLLKQPCAVKLIRPEKAGDPDTLRRFEREVQATARLRHWNTVRILDYGRSADGTFYYVMEHLSGLTLQGLVQKHGPLPPGRAVHLLRQACAALREAHAAGLVHRDLKPANVMACELGGEHDVVKVLDFGLVKVADPGGGDATLTREGVIAGTPAYMSPEQASGGGGLDARSDIYSLGAVAYFLLTGRPPFHEGTMLQVITAHLRDPVVRPTELRPEIPADLEAVVLRCLEKDPGKRFGDVGSLEAALASCACAADWGENAAN